MNYSHRRLLSRVVILILFSPLRYTGAQPTPEFTSTFNTTWLDAVISIEAGTQSSPRPIGTGFVISTQRGSLMLVTAAHVVRSADGKLRPSLRYRRSDLDTVVTEEELVRAQVGTWFFLPSTDLACRFVGWPSGQPAAPAIPISAALKRESVQTGAPLIVLGFPVGLRSTTHKHPVARRGMAARVGAEGFLVEAFVFPGSSGGPVVYTPQIKVGIGLASPLVNSERLVGIISSYIPYEEPGISPQTGRTRIVFEENSGLSEVIPIDALLELLSRADVQQQEQALPGIRAPNNPTSTVDRSRRPR